MLGIHNQITISSGVSRISFWGGVQIFSGKVGVFAWREVKIFKNGAIW